VPQVTQRLGLTLSSKEQTHIQLQLTKGSELPPPRARNTAVCAPKRNRKKEGTARVRNKDTEEGRDKRAIPDSCLRP